MDLTKIHTLVGKIEKKPSLFKIALLKKMVDELFYDYKPKKK